MQNAEFFKFESRGLKITSLSFPNMLIPILTSRELIEKFFTVKQATDYAYISSESSHFYHIAFRGRWVSQLLSELLQSYPVACSIGFGVPSTACCSDLGEAQFSHSGHCLLQCSKDCDDSAVKYILYHPRSLTSVGGSTRSKCEGHGNGR